MSPNKGSNNEASIITNASPQDPLNKPAHEVVVTVTAAPISIPVRNSAKYIQMHRYSFKLPQV